MMYLGMVDSKIVLFGQTAAYTFYCLAILLVVGWFSWKLTKPGKGTKVSDGLFYTFVAFLTVLGVSLHLVTAQTIPWVDLDLNRDTIQPDRVVQINVADHEFQLPSDKITINCGERVLFDVTTADLTYGFGLFREDQSMVMQMQVVPGHRNDLLWEFNKNEIYSIRSTEYSGPKGIHMTKKDVVEVIGCE